MEKRGFFEYRNYLILVVFLVFLGFVSGVITELEISITPPLLINDIPNQTWAVNQTLYDAFDLDDYFFDNQGFPLTYWADEVENITITIDEDNLVSFSPDEDFMGVRTVVFYANNGYFNTSSNVVYLNVGTDDKPPQWSQPRINRATVYQNSIVNFSTIWTDNVQLEKYMFSINQGSGWVNYPEVNFFGKYNFSRHGIQISAAGGTVVYWVFYAWDTSMNMNVTDIQSFEVSSITYPETETGRGRTIVERIRETIFPRVNVSNFNVDPESFRITLRKGRTFTSILKIRNVGTEDLELNVREQSLEGVVIFSENSFSLNSGDTKQVTIDFISDKLEVGQYFGYIVVYSSTESKTIPVIIDVKDEAVKFDLNVTVHKKKILPNHEVRADISILNSQDLIDKTGVLSYSIKDFNGNFYDTSEEEIDFSENLKFERALFFPENSPEGEYIFYARVVTPEAIAIDSDLFEVGVRAFYLAWIKPFFLFLLIILLAILFAFLMIKYKKYKDRERTLSLYLMLMSLKKLLEEEKIDDALDLYIVIKSRYGEKVPKSTIENKEELKKEVQNLILKLKQQIPKRTQENINKEEGKDSGEVLKEEGEKTEEKKEKPQEEASEKKKEEKEEKPKQEEKSEEEKKEDKPKEETLKGEEENKNSDKKEEKKEEKPKQEEKTLEKKEEKKTEVKKEKKEPKVKDGEKGKNSEKKRIKEKSEKNIKDDFKKSKNVGGEIKNL